MASGSRPSVGGQRVYEDFEPHFSWRREAARDTLLLELPGFTKEELKVKIDNNGNLMIRGERLVEGKRWSRFHKEFRLPDDCNPSEVRAKFESNNLYVIMPKLITITQDSEPTPSGPQGGFTKQEGGERKTPRADGNGPPPKPSGETNKKVPQPTGSKKETSKEKVQDLRPMDSRKVASISREEEKGMAQAVKPTDGKKEALDLPKNDKDHLLGSNEKKEEKEKRETNGTGPKWIKSSGAGLTDGGVKITGRFKNGDGGLGLTADKPDQLIVNIIVAIIVLLGLGLYASYKLRKSPMEPYQEK